MTPPESTVWECHGTGTSLGDPIEVGAVRKVQTKYERSEPLMLGTSKSNVGHLEGSAAAIAMVRCCMVVRKAKALPTLHLAVLNPHLEHVHFDAIFCNESNPYLYKQGHCQVSSFGVGGTNGHAIFWGEQVTEQEFNPKTLFMKKLKMQTPTIIVDGPDPADWDYSGPGLSSKPGDKYELFTEKDPISGNAPIRWKKVDHSEEQARAEYYSTTGTHNNWQGDAMEHGDIDSLFYQDLTLPPDGVIKFRLLVDGDYTRALGPVEENCTRRSAPLCELTADFTTSWLIEGSPNDSIRIELLVPPKGVPSINWFKML